MTIKSIPKKSAVLKIAREKIHPGERKQIQINIASLYDYTNLTIPVEVIRGTKEGPTMFISGAIHGDEINGTEIIKRLLQLPVLNKIKGTLILIPVVNVFGYNYKSRYLPDRRDLNRCFPGNASGSLGSKLAHIFMKQIVSQCDYGIDLHTGAIHRSNLPQIRASLDDPKTEELARCFGVPVIINSKLRDGSLREAARKRKVRTLLFEGGEALRFDESAIQAGLNGCISVMRSINMLQKVRVSKSKADQKVYIAEESYWVRASHSGSFELLKKIGDHVKKDELLATITDPFGKQPFQVFAEAGGIIIGLSMIPLVNQGDAMVHIATFEHVRKVKKAIDLFEEMG